MENTLVEPQIQLLQQSRIPPDLHIHSAYCGHAEGTLDEFVKAAIQLGLTEIGFAGHFPYPLDFKEPVADCVIPEFFFPVFVSEVDELREIYSDSITIHLAVEVDYLPGFMEKTKTMCQKFSFDYVYGSVHIVDGVPIDYSEDVLLQHIEKLGGVDGLWEKYWQSLEGLIESELCQVIAHLDLPKKFSAAHPIPDQSKRVESILSLIKDRDIVLEINTGGIDRSYLREPYPSVSILHQAAKKGIDVTLGSDAHRPEEVGRHFRETAKILKSLGWKRVVVFEEGEKQYRSLLA